MELLFWEINSISPSVPLFVFGGISMFKQWPMLSAYSTVGEKLHQHFLEDKARVSCLWLPANSWSYFPCDSIRVCHNLASDPSALIWKLTPFSGFGCVLKDMKSQRNYLACLKLQPLISPGVGCLVGARRRGGQQGGKVECQQDTLVGT